MKNKLVEQVLISFQKRFAMTKEEADAKGLSGIERKAFIRVDGVEIPPDRPLIDGKKIEVIPRRDEDYLPVFTISDSDRLERALKEYLDTVRTVNIKSTKMDDRHTDRYFLFNVWKNATNYDFQHPEQFIKRYTDFIQDNTFMQYDYISVLGITDNHLLVVKREEDDYGFETPYIMHLSLTNGKHIYNLPWVRYGISQNEKGEKIAYIYALQNMDPSPSEKYNEQVKKSINKVNSGVKKYRNVTPSAIATLGIFFGMLEKEGIHQVRVPDFLIGRYGRFTNATTEEETDRIQTNLTDKFLRNFLRLSEQLPNVSLIGYDGFLWVKLDEMKTPPKNTTLDVLYSLGRGQRAKFSEKSLEER